MPWFQGTRQQNVEGAIGTFHTEHSVASGLTEQALFEQDALGALCRVYGCRYASMAFKASSC
jgi:hypothetical protein